MFVRADVGGLHYILSFVIVAQNGPSHAVEALVVTAHDDFKHPRRARQHSGHNFFVTDPFRAGTSERVADSLDIPHTGAC